MGVQRLFLTLSERLYWTNLYTVLHDYIKSCDVYLKAKRNYAFRSTPLHPLKVINGPCEYYHLDHKNLWRPTKKGNVGILSIIDAFSWWPVFKAVPDFTALTTAKVFFREIVTVFGVPTHIITGSTVVLTRCQDDGQSQWKTPIFGPSQLGNLLTDFDKI